MPSQRTRKGEPLTLDEAKQRLKVAVDNDDDGEFHSIFDDLLERKLAEYDPQFLTGLKKIYEDSGLSRWYS